MNKVTGPACVGTVPSRRSTEYESCPSLRLGFLITITASVGASAPGSTKREHGVGWVGFEAVVAFAPQLDELCRRHVPDDPLRPIREEER